MILNIILIILTAIFLMISIISFLQKGPIISTIYYFSTEEERKELRTKDRYYYIGTSALIMAIIFGILLVEEIFNLSSLLRIRIIIIIILCIYAIIRYAQIESRRIKNKKNKT